MLNIWDHLRYKIDINSKSVQGIAAATAVAVVST